MAKAETVEEFLPADYTPPTSSGAYMKLQDGDNVFRILSTPVLGYEYWTEDNKPVRSKNVFAETPNAKKDKDGNPQKAKHFWAFVVWNYTTKNIEILELTQSSIQKFITGLSKDSDWGNPKGYDIKITKTGNGLDTKYSISPKPHKELSAEVAEALSSTEFDMDAIYENKNPFDGKF